MTWGLGLAAIVITSCSPANQQDPRDLASTMMAETALAAPSDTPLPSPTEVPPTETQTPTPTVTATPGPVVFLDDFSANRGHWERCRGCTWEDGALHMGPYAPALKPDEMLAICIPCATPTYYRMTVEITFVEGQTDRGYGLLYGLNDQEFALYEISPLYLVTLAARYDRASRGFYLLNPTIDQLLTGLVKPGFATNQLEMIVERAGSGKANLFFRVNDRTAFVLYNRPASPGRVGLLLDSHAIQVAFDNFEFEEIEP